MEKNEKIRIKGNHSYVDWLRGRNYFQQPTYRYLTQADMLSQTLFKKTYNECYTYQQNYVVLMMRKAGVK